MFQLRVPSRILSLNNFDDDSEHTEDHPGGYRWCAPRVAQLTCARGMITDLQFRKCLLLCVSKFEAKMSQDGPKLLQILNVPKCLQLRLRPRIDDIDGINSPALLLAPGPHATPVSHVSHMPRKCTGDNPLPLSRSLQTKGHFLHELQVK